MNLELEEKLKSQFPQLLRRLRWGLECDDGWFELIEGTLKAVALCSEPDTAVVQIKEKFGGLRIYLESATERAWDICEQAERQSFEVCEGCGAPGRVFRRHGWMYNRCQVCECLLNLQE